MIQWIRIFLLLVLVGQLSHGELCSAREELTSSVLDAAVSFMNKVKSISSLSKYTMKPMDCSEIQASGVNKSGIHTIWPRSRLSRGRPLEVYCDMKTDGGGWTVIQRRGDYGRAHDYFRKLWKEYKEGFGNIDKDFWLGNDNIYSLTNQNLYSARFDLQDVQGEKRYAVYDTFWIEDEDRKYTLHIQGYRGDAGDSMTRMHNNQKFTTTDQNNDKRQTENCADLDKGAWWYNACHEANLNGLFYRGKYDKPNYEGIVWYKWKGYKESLTFTEIKIRPKDFRLSPTEKSSDTGHEQANTPR